MRNAILFIVGLCLLVVGCTKDNETGPYGLKTSETLRINIRSEPPSLDWNKSTDTTSALIQDNIMEGLVAYDLDDPKLSLKPALASKWESENNAQKWVFTLRDDVRWTDGKKLTPQHVVNGWKRLLKPETASEYAYFLYAIKNAQKFNEGKIEDFSKVGVTIDDQGRIVVQLEKPASYFPKLLTHHSTYPIRKDVIEKHGDQWTSADNIVTLGPFYLKVWEHDKNIVLERNEDYYGEKPEIKNILAYMINEDSTAINLFDSGKLDALNSLPSKQLSQLKKRPGYKETGILTIFYYGFNTEKPPMNKVKVRRAISHAIDRKQVTDMLNGGEVPLTGWVPPGMFGYQPEVGIEFDAEKADKLLDEAGYKDRSKFPKVELSYNTNEDHKRVAENIQAQLRKNLGIEVELNNEEWKTYLDSLKTDPSQIFRLGWLADYPDPHNFMNLMTSFSDNNHTRWGSEKYDRLIKKAASVTDRKKRKKLYIQAQKLLTEQAVPAAPVFASVSHMLVADRVQNYPANSMGRFVYKEVTLK